MNVTVQSKDQWLILSFPALGDFMGFLLTCLEDRDFGMESEIYRDCLNQVYIPRKGKQRIEVIVHGHVEVLQTLTNMALANGGASRREARPNKTNFHVRTIADLLRSARLREARVQETRYGHVLLALWNVQASGISALLAYVWNLGVSATDVAFVRETRRDAPTHLVRVCGLRHPDAFHRWCRSQREVIEVYAPTSATRLESRFYTQWGFRYPAPGLERLVELDRELILLRPRRGNPQMGTEWITFGADNINFFRKTSQFVDLEFAPESVALVELEEDTREVSVPIELAIIPKRNRGRTTITEIDKQIDVQRRVLQDLERRRARLASNEEDEVYFAYRFDQVEENELNPRLVRLMQQRLGSLCHYEYAFCRPKKGNPYHLVLANRSHRQLDFSLQPADQVYYQPAQWRRWGANLYLPLESELAPRIDTNDAIPLLSKILERSADSLADSGECAAVIWEPSGNGEIFETRVRSTAPLLSQYRLLNSFQRNQAAVVEQETRARLAETIRQTRSRVDVQLDGLARDLLQHAADRTAKLETTYSRLESSLQAAEQLAVAVEPRVEMVSQFIKALPGVWVDFVNAVLELHQRLVTPQLEAFEEFRGRLHVGREHARALVAGTRNFAEMAKSQHDRFQEQFAHCEEIVRQDQQQLTALKEVASRASSVLTEVARIHGQLDARLELIRQTQEQVERMQREIDEIRGREQEVKKRLDELRPLYEQCRQKAVEIERMKKDADTQQLALQEKAAQVARVREEVKERCVQIAAQLQRIEGQLTSFAKEVDELEQGSRVLQEQMAMIEAHTAVISLWEERKDSWQAFVRAAMEAATGRIAQAYRSIQDHEKSSSEVRSHLNTAGQEVGLAEQLPGSSREGGSHD